jgi:hypothetical protein
MNNILEENKNNIDMTIENTSNSEEVMKTKKENLVNELNKFLLMRTVYETVPENMKVN